MHNSLVNSVNTASVHLAYQVGLPKIINLAIDGINLIDIIEKIAIKFKIFSSLASASSFIVGNVFIILLK